MRLSRCFDAEGSLGPEFWEETPKDFLLAKASRGHIDGIPGFKNMYPAGKVPVAGSIQRPWPWRLFLAVIVALLVTFGTHYALPPDLGLTSPDLWCRDNVCTATFRATNNTRQTITAVLEITAGLGTPGDSTGPSTYRESARRTLSVVFKPKEQRTISCNLLLQGPPVRPNTAQIVITSITKGAP